MSPFFELGLTINNVIYAIASFIAVLYFITDNERLLLSCRITTYLAFAMHTGIVIVRWLDAGHAPFVGRFESINFFVWSMGFAVVSTSLAYRNHLIIPAMQPAITIFYWFSTLAPKEVKPLFPALDTIWFEIHVGASFLAYGFFAVGAAAAALYLHALAKEKPAIEVRTLDALAYKSAAWGFFLFTFGMTSGGYWAFLAWSNYFIWTPKEIWSVLLWIFYCFYLHARYTNRWRGRRSAYIAMVGITIVLATFLGVSLLMQSSHNL